MNKESANISQCHPSVLETGFKCAGKDRERLVLKTKPWPRQAYKYFITSGCVKNCQLLTVFALSGDKM